MKTLSAAATILLPLSLIAGLMGMNVMVPFDASAERVTFGDLLPFSIICICMIIVAFYLYSYFKKRKYL
jgi:Mg2+ and Co2+ transporter CorA